MKRLLRKELLICLLLLAACDSSEPAEDNTFAGKYVNAPGFVDAELNLNQPTDPSSSFDYEGVLDIETSGRAQLECTGNETTLTCTENPAVNSTAPYTLTKTSEGLNICCTVELRLLKE